MFDNRSGPPISRTEVPPVADRADLNDLKLPSPIFSAPQLASAVEMGVHSPAPQRGFWRQCAAMYRQELHSIPASVCSTVVALAIIRPVLGREEVKAFMLSAGSIIAGTMSISAHVGLWYVCHMCLEPLSKKIFQFLGIAKPSSDEHYTGLFRKYFAVYNIAFTLAQVAAQSWMLHAGVEPKTAQTWNSIAGNCVWLTTLPLAQYGLRKLAERRQVKNA